MSPAGVNEVGSGAGAVALRRGRIAQSAAFDWVCCCVVGMTDLGDVNGHAAAYITRAISPKQRELAWSFARR